MLRKKGAKPSTTLGRERFRFPPRGSERASEKLREKEKPCPFPLLPVPLSCRLPEHSGSSRPSASQPGSHRAKPASQSGVRISLRGSNVSAEGLLDGSSSDNSQARRACCYILKCKRDTNVDRECERKVERRKREADRKESFGLGRTHSPL